MSHQNQGMKAFILSRTNIDTLVSGWSVSHQNPGMKAFILSRTNIDTLVSGWSVSHQRAGLSHINLLVRFFGVFFCW